MHFRKEFISIEFKFQTCYTWKELTFQATILSFHIFSYSKEPDICSLYIFNTDDYVYTAIINLMKVEATPPNASQ